MNQSMFPRKADMSPYHRAMIALLDKLQFQERVPIELLGTVDGDCVGWIMCPWSSFRSVKLARHGAIAFQPLDVRIRRFDGDSHYPSFAVFEMSNKRSRKPNMSEARAARKASKLDKLAVKKSFKRK